MISWVKGTEVCWNPSDDSIESLLIGDILFGRQQMEVRKAASKVKDLSTLMVSKVDVERKIITVTAAEESA